MVIRAEGSSPLTVSLSKDVQARILKPCDEF